MTMTTLAVTGMVHELKAWPEYFEAVRDCRKPFDVRREDDRHFEPGDLLVLREWDNAEQEYTGREETCFITYVYRDGPVPMPEGVVVLGLTYATGDPVGEEEDMIDSARTDR